MRKITFFLTAAAILFSLHTSASAQGQQRRSIYSPKMDAFYTDIDASNSELTTNKPLIGVSHDNTMKNTTTKSLELAGAVPVILPVTEDADLLDDILSRLDGLVFSGGEDIDPSWYGEEKSEKCGNSNEARDRFEILLFKKASERNIPILGICRGQQLINVAMGGTLIQDIPTEKGDAVKHGVYSDSTVPAHDITIQPGSIAHKIYGSSTYGVNSRHHQAIDKVAPELVVTAWSSDDIPEAVEAPNRHIFAFQSHPELNAAAGQTDHLKVFDYLVSQAKLYKEAKAIHSRILSVDTHCDTPMSFSRGGSVALRSSRQQVSVQKMQEGHLDAQYLAAFLSQRDETPESLAKAAADCQNIIDNIYKDVAAHSESAGIAITMEDALRLKAEGKKAFFIGIENGFGLGGDINLLEKYRDQGVGYVTLCHSYDNGIAHSSTNTEDENLGLTDFGKKVVKEMNKLGMLIDLSHASMGTFWDVMKYSKLPVVCTHSGAKDVYFHNRNLNDDQLRALAKNGGVIQVCIFASYMTADASKTNLDDVIEHIDHCVKVAGIDHVGIGSDFDGGGGVLGLNGSNDMIRITEKLLERGYSEQDIAKIWGGNWFRVLAANQAAAKK